MDDASRRLWGERAVRAGHQSFPRAEYVNWPLCGRLLPHALAVAFEKEREGIQVAEAGRLLNAVVPYMHNRGQYVDAEPLCLSAMKITRAALGEHHPEYASSLNNLAALYRAMGRHAKAEPLCLKAMELRRTALGEHHPNYAKSLSNLVARQPYFAARIPGDLGGVHPAFQDWYTTW